MTKDKLEQAKGLVKQIEYCNDNLEKLGRAYKVSFILKADFNFQANHLTIDLFDEDEELSEPGKSFHQQAIHYFMQERDRLQAEFDEL